METTLVCTENKDQNRHRNIERNPFRRAEGKRIGLITNPTGVDNQLKSTIDILHEAPSVQLVALYGPEHGGARRCLRRRQSGYIRRFEYPACPFILFMERRESQPKK